MNPRMQDTLTAATDAWRFVQRNWPLTTKTNPLVYAAIAGAGVAVGIGAGLLFAPQSGGELRASIAERSRGLFDTIESKIGSLASSAESAVEDAVTTTSTASHNGGSNHSHGRRHGKHARA